MRHVRAIVVTLATGAILLAGVGRSSAAVLCEGLDGHVKVEASTLGVCVSDADRSDETRAAGETAYTAQRRGEHCGPCVDTPLEMGAGADSRMTRHAKRAEVKVPALSFFLKMNTWAAAHVSHVARGSHSILAGHMPIGLRTVTLLI